MARIFLQMGNVLDWVLDRTVNLPNMAYSIDPSLREETRAYFRPCGYQFGKVP
jgi:hypothetical protein